MGRHRGHAAAREEPIESRLSPMDSHVELHVLGQDPHGLVRGGWAVSDDGVECFKESAFSHEGYVKARIRRINNNAHVAWVLTCVRESKVSLYMCPGPGFTYNGLHVSVKS